jgi:hypothetical protein
MKIRTTCCLWGSLAIILCLIATAPAMAQTETGGGTVGHSNYKTSAIVLSTTLTTLTRLDETRVSILPATRTPAFINFCSEFWSPTGAGVALTLVLDRAAIPPVPSEFVFPDDVTIDSGLDVNPETKCFTWNVNQLQKEVFHDFEIFWRVVGAGEVFAGKRTTSVISGKRF